MLARETFDPRNLGGLIRIAYGAKSALRSREPSGPFDAPRRHPKRRALGEPSQAQELLKKLLPIIEADAARDPGDPTTWMELAVTRAILGKGVEAVAASDHAIAIIPETLDKVNGMPPGEWRTIALAWSGHKADAIRELGIRLRTPSDIRAEYLPTDVAWFPLRDDPGFQSLIKDPANYQPRF